MAQESRAIIRGKQASILAIFLGLGMIVQSLINKGVSIPDLIIGGVLILIAVICWGSLTIYVRVRR